MDIVADKGGVTHKPVMLNLVQPHGSYVFPVGRMCTPDLKMLTLWFFTIALGHY